MNLIKNLSEYYLNLLLAVALFVLVLEEKF